MVKKVKLRTVRAVAVIMVMALTFSLMSMVAWADSCNHTPKTTTHFAGGGSDRHWITGNVPSPHWCDVYTATYQVRTACTKCGYIFGSHMYSEVTHSSPYCPHFNG